LTKNLSRLAFIWISSASVVRCQDEVEYYFERRSGRCLVL